ncbi:MAG TPA: peptide ligase PGM1-related protein [Actinomycetota bacterium]|nr:peptide ligase PGM1-related protein [Actinomycetota bacterium]
MRIDGESHEHADTGDGSDAAFSEVQAKLGAAWSLNKPGVETNHVLIVLPSYSIGESLLSHYADRIASLEHRFLVAFLMLDRIPGCEMVFLTSEAPSDEVIDYYCSLVPPDRRQDVRRRFRVMVVPDSSAQAVATKLLRRKDLMEELRGWVGGRPALIEPWNVTGDEVCVATQLGVPINGTDPALWPLGYKSAGRKLFAAAGVPAPFGCEDVRTVDDVVAAVTSLRASRPQASGVVIKHDNSGAGDGNVVLRFRGEDESGLRETVEALPDWYLRDLRLGSVVEELVTGEAFASPSVQVDISPFGEVSVLSTHEQLLGGEDGQVYMGCRFPADPGYAAEIAAHGAALGRELAGRGAIGRLSVDFAAARDAGGRWSVYALEINLRKGGTTHPYAVLRNLVTGRYDTGSGCWMAPDGTPRFYVSTDNLVDDAWLDLPATDVIEAVSRADLSYNHGSGTGVVLHMFTGLQIDGRVGLTAIGCSRDHADDLREASRAAIDACAASSTARGS